MSPRFRKSKWVRGRSAFDIGWLVATTPWSVVAYVHGRLVGSQSGASGALPLVALNCGSGGISCSSSAMRLGVEVQYQFLPSSSVNPWLGYGIGYSVASIKAVDTERIDQPLRIGMGAPDDGGRLPRCGGSRLRWFVDLGLGTFTSVYDPFEDVTSEIPSGNQRTHIWLGIGGRAVLFRSG